MLAKLFLVISLVLGAYFLAQTQAFKQPQCRGKETKLTANDMKVMGDCLKDFSPTSKTLAEIPKENMGCVGKCILSKEGLIDDKGMPSKDNVLKMLNGTLDDEVAKEADALIGKCIDEKSKGIDPNEKNCQTYWPFVECVCKALMEVCMPPKGKDGKKE